MERLLEEEASAVKGMEDDLAAKQALSVQLQGEHTLLCGVPSVVLASALAGGKGGRGEEQDGGCRAIKSVQRGDWQVARLPFPTLLPAPGPMPHVPSHIYPCPLPPSSCPAPTAEVKVWQAHHDNLKKCLMWAPVLSIEQQIEVRLLCLPCLPYAFLVACWYLGW
jgi:hypothetical protein